MAILMCEPTYFQVLYVINPWMNDNIGNVQHHEAEVQWSKLYNEITVAGETVITVFQKPDVPDMVFTANAGLILPGQKAIVSNFKKSQRQPETKYWSETFQMLYHEVIEIPVAFEGAGDALYDSNETLWLASGFRTDKSAVDYIKEYYEQTETLKLINENFYHLDTAFCPLKNGCLMYNPNAFSKKSNEKIKDYFGCKAIAVSDEDANNFACNAVNVNNTVILNKASDQLKSTLHDVGFTVVEVPMTQFMKSGGSAKCLTLKI